MGYQPVICSCAVGLVHLQRVRGTSQAKAISHSFYLNVAFAICLVLVVLQNDISDLRYWLSTFTFKSHPQNYEVLAEKYGFIHPMETRAALTVFSTSKCKALVDIAGFIYGFWCW